MLVSHMHARAHTCSKSASLARKLHASPSPVSSMASSNGSSCVVELQEGGQGGTPRGEPTGLHSSKLHGAHHVLALPKLKPQKHAQVHTPLAPNTHTHKTNAHGDTHTLQPLHTHPFPTPSHLIAPLAGRARVHGRHGPHGHQPHIHVPRIMGGSIPAHAAVAVAVPARRLVAPPPTLARVGAVV